MSSVERCPCCSASVVVVGQETQHYQLHPKIKQAMTVINGVQEALWHQWKDNAVLYEYSLQLELSLKRLNEHLFGVDDYFESE